MYELVNVTAKEHFSWRSLKIIKRKYSLSKAISSAAESCSLPMSHVKTFVRPLGKIKDHWNMKIHTFQDHLSLGGFCTTPFNFSAGLGK